MLKLRLHLTKLFKVVLIITISSLHLFNSLAFELNKLNNIKKYHYYDKVIRNDNDNLQSETAITKKDNKDLQTFLFQIEKQKSKSYLNHQIPNSYGYLFSYYSEKDNFHYQKIDNKNINLRSPPVIDYNS